MFYGAFYLEFKLKRDTFRCGLERRCVEKTDTEESPDSKKLFSRGFKGRAPGQLTAGRSDPTESATENKPPIVTSGVGKGEMVG